MDKSEREQVAREFVRWLVESTDTFDPVMVRMALDGEYLRPDDEQIERLVAGFVGGETPADLVATLRGLDRVYAVPVYATVATEIGGNRRYAPRDSHVTRPLADLTPGEKASITGIEVHIDEKVGS